MRPNARSAQQQWQEWSAKAVSLTRMNYAAFLRRFYLQQPPAKVIPMWRAKCLPGLAATITMMLARALTRRFDLRRKTEPYIRAYHTSQVACSLNRQTLSNAVSSSHRPLHEIALASLAFTLQSTFRMFPPKNLC